LEVGFIDIFSSDFYDLRDSLVGNLPLDISLVSRLTYFIKTVSVHHDIFRFLELLGAHFGPLGYSISGHRSDRRDTVKSNQIVADLPNLIDSQK
jgi:hypothetical protein